VARVSVFIMAARYLAVDPCPRPPLGINAR